MYRNSWPGDTDGNNEQQQQQQNQQGEVVAEKSVVVETKPNELENFGGAQKDDDELSLEDLPDELILKIISKLDYRFHNRIRCASRGLSSIYTQHMLHCFRANAHQSERLREDHKELAVTYEILHEATKYYIECGYESTFCGALSQLFHQLDHCTKIPQNVKLIRFLGHFYQMVETRTNQQAISTKERFVYILTLVSVLRKFRTFKLVCSRRLGMHWHFQIEVSGVCLGILWWNERLVSYYPQKRAHLLAIISRLAHVHLMNEQLQFIWEKTSVVYLYGISSDESRKLSAQTCFDFMVYAHDDIVQMLRSVVELNVPVKLPEAMPKAPLIVNVSIKCGRAIDWGCRDGIDLQIGPLSFTSCESDLADYYSDREFY